MAYVDIVFLHRFNEKIIELSRADRDPESDSGRWRSGFSARG